MISKTEGGPCMHGNPERGADRAKSGGRVSNLLDNVVADPHPSDLIPKRVWEPNIPKAGPMVVQAWNDQQQQGPETS